MLCNAKKSVLMVVAPKCKNKIVSVSFPVFKLGNATVQFVNEFRYLGHIITENQKDDDIDRETRNLFIRTNVELRRLVSALVRSSYVCLNHIVWASMILRFGNITMLVLLIVQSLLISSVLKYSSDLVVVTVLHRCYKICISCVLIPYYSIVVRNLSLCGIVAIIILIDF